MNEALHRPAREEPPYAGARSVGVKTVVTIQYLRALAASLIVFHHAMAPPAVAPYYTHHFAEFGVDLFFVISGYIMWTTTAVGRSGVLAFWTARIVRVVPLYWLFTTMLVAVTLLLPQAMFNPPLLEPWHVFKSYLFVPASAPPIYTLGWTLNYEMFFYFVFGLCLLVPGRRARFIVLAVALGGLVLTGRLRPLNDPLLAHYTSPIMLEFLAGVAIGAIGVRLARLPALLATALIAAGVLVIAHYAWAGPSAERFIELGIPAALIVVGSLAFEPKVRVAPNRLGVFLGDASYSIYLAHPFAERIWYFATSQLLGGFISPLAVTLYVIGAVLSGIAGGVVSYLVLERPLLAAGRRLTGRKPVREPAYA
jgi:peptidoglycan/LPS O-acetylase OafA/YrhL